jgi:ABC-type uncharacterized transport system ATPase subunit
MQPVISVNNLSLTYRVPLRGAGLGDAVRALFRRTYQEILAVRDLTFDLFPGEVVGFIGPNGAGKTTTLKMLSGILHPTSGEVRVLGCEPWKRETHFLRQIAMIRGSRPIGGPGELTVLDSLRMQQLIYEIPQPDFRRTLDELTGLLEIGPLLERQVRALSLGEKMRCGLALSLLYRPAVLFLDEPTLGLDVSAVQMIRRFIAGYSRQTGAAVLLTSHYMADVEALCRRIILIDKGALQYDGDLDTLAARLSPYMLLKVGVSDSIHPNWSSFGDVIEAEESKASLRVHRTQVSSVTTRLLAELPVSDLTIEEPPLESVIDRIYREGVA